MTAILVVLVIGVWHTLSLSRAGASVDAWVAGILWLVSLAVAVMIGTALPAPSLLGLVFRLFGGLSVWLRSY